MSDFIFMLGNVSEGFKAVGPFEDVDAACEYGEGREGWVMELTCQFCSEDLHGRPVYCSTHSEGQAS